MVPHFCFICGFLGHSDKDCVKRIDNDDRPFRFSSELRCSPLKPFERRVCKVKAMPSSGVARNLFFSSVGSAGSSSSRSKHGEQWEEAIPPRVDARDNFETKEKEGDRLVDEQLAQQLNMMGTGTLNMQQSGKKVFIQQGEMIEASKEGGTGENLQSLEMIPAIANLHQQASFGDVSSDDSSGGNRKRIQTVLGGRNAGWVQQALLEYQQAMAIDGGEQKDAGKTESREQTPYVVYDQKSQPNIFSALAGYG